MFLGVKECYEKVCLLAIEIDDIMSHVLGVFLGSHVFPYIDPYIYHPVVSYYIA